MVQHHTPQSITETSPESLLLAAVLGGTAGLTDLQLLCAMLNEPSDTQRAESILSRVGNLHLLVHSGPIELQALGLTDGEIARLLVQLELCARVIAQRRSGRLAGLADTVREIRIRGEQRDRTCVGLIAIDPENRVRLDRVLFEGTSTMCPVDTGMILRETLRSGADGILLYRWQPTPNLVLHPSDSELADRLRVASSALGLTVLDVIVVCEQTYWSGRMAGDWAE